MSCFDSNLQKAETKLGRRFIDYYFQVATVKFILKVTMEFNQVLNLLFLSVSFPLCSPPQYQGHLGGAKKY